MLRSTSDLPFKYLKADNRISSPKFQNMLIDEVAHAEPLHHDLFCWQIQLLLYLVHKELMSGEPRYHADELGYYCDLHF